MFNTVKKIYTPNSNTVAYYECVLNNGTKMSVPLDEANTDYQAIQEWAKIEGNNIIDPGA
tara:strand:+ start:440 stop:619 length:180 start_codon:yes stop_codon:yes gene_type:complete